MTTSGLSRSEIARRVARDLPDGAVVNLGIGMPTLVPEFIPDGREVLFHSENGILGFGLDTTAGDPDLINASKDPISLLPGGSFFSHSDSFAMIRGRHIDIAVMGAFEVSANGDLANWSSGHDAIPAVGGAMDLAVGALAVFVMMTQTSPRGTPKLVECCSLPLTATGCVRRIYTDLGILVPAGDHFDVLELAPNVSWSQLQANTGAGLRDAR